MCGMMMVQAVTCVLLQSAGSVLQLIATNHSSPSFHIGGHCVAMNLLAGPGTA